jgi:hypothetical protein
VKELIKKTLTTKAARKTTVLSAALFSTVVMTPWQ